MTCVVYNSLSSASKAQGVFVVMIRFDGGVFL
jgi:hypothetical protein